MCAGRTVGLVCTRTTNVWTREDVIEEASWGGRRGSDVGVDDEEDEDEEVGGDLVDVEAVEVSSGWSTANHHDRGGCRWSGSVDVGRKQEEGCTKHVRSSYPSPSYGLSSPSPCSLIIAISSSSSSISSSSSSSPLYISMQSLKQSLSLIERCDKLSLLRCALFLPSCPLITSSFKL